MGASSPFKADGQISIPEQMRTGGPFKPLLLEWGFSADSIFASAGKVTSIRGFCSNQDEGATGPSHLGTGASPDTPSLRLSETWDEDSTLHHKLCHPDRSEAKWRDLRFNLLNQR